MKRIFSIVVFIPIFVFSQQTKEVLFVGNSYTFYNDLPNMVKQIALSFGDTLIYDQNTPGGATLQMHSTNTQTLSKISQQQWDNVIIQCQSQEPSFSPSQVSNDVFPYAQILIDSIESNSVCTEPIFFMTWGRKNGDSFNAEFSPPVATYLGMQSRLRNSYLEMAFDNNSELQTSFNTLTPGKQREYCEHIASAKRETTKLSRIEKITPMVLNGVGLHDKYKNC